MKPRIKNGLAAGSAGLVLLFCSLSINPTLCAPLISLAAGAAVGLFTAKEENSATKGNGARAGAAAGSIAGALMIIYYVVVAIRIVGSTQLAEALQSSEPSQRILVIGGALLVPLAFGIASTVGTVLTGALAGYLRAPGQTMPSKAA